MDAQDKILKNVPVKSHFGNLNIESSDPSCQMAPKWQNHVCGILCHYAIHFDTAWNINWNGKFETSQRRLPILENVRLYCNDTEICVSRNWHKTWVWAHIYESDCIWNVIYADNTTAAISNTHFGHLRTRDFLDISLWESLSPFLGILHIKFMFMRYIHNHWQRYISKRMMTRTLWRKYHVRY